MRTLCQHQWFASVQLLARSGHNAAHSAGRLHTPTGVSKVAAVLPSLPKLNEDIKQEATSLAAAIAVRKRVLIGIDPDNSGAVAIIAIAANGSIRDALQDADVLLHDMPCIRVAVGKRQRKQADPAAVVAIVMEAMQSALAGESLHAVLEEPVPNPTNGKQSVFGSGFAFGLWNGVLSSHGVALDTVSARRWKLDLGLNNRGKEGSRALAAALFPRAQHLLRRKKDHGRAEAMLILAWALGLRVPKTSQTAVQLAKTNAGAADDLSFGEEEDAVKLMTEQLQASAQYATIVNLGSRDTEHAEDKQLAAVV